MTEKETIDLFTTDKATLLNIVNSEKFIKPLNYYFLLALPTVEEKTKGGIILAQESKDTALTGNNIGRIVGIGGTIGGSTGAYAQCRELEVGDYVGYNPHAGLPQHHDGYKLITIADQGLRTRIKDIAAHTDGIFTAYKIKGVS